MRISSVYDRDQTDAKILTCLAPIIPWALYLSPVTQVVHARCRFVVWLQKYVCSMNISGKVAVPFICYSDSSILDDRLHATQRTIAWTTEATMSENSSPEFRAQECVDDRVYRRAGYLQNYTPKINYEKYLDDKFSTMQYTSSSCNSKVGAQQTTKTRTAATIKRVDFILALATALWIVPFLLLFHKLTAIFPYAKNMYNRGATNATTRGRVGAQFLRYWHWSIFAKGNGPAPSH